ncbi:class I SAM-dependent methyltransferase [bacterium]|nr:class I SAM-dependent methyltransferase [bacterium]
MPSDDANTTPGPEETTGRERVFHDAWADDIRPEDVAVHASFHASTCPENRFIAEWLGDVSGLRLLDLGCGAGEAAVHFALQGADVTAYDVSPGMLRLADAVAQHHGVRIACRAGDASQLDFGDNTFDVVYAANVLHHADTERTVDEIVRVLKPGGRLVSWDPLAHNPLICVYRRLAGTMRSHDERPLRMKDLRMFRERFAAVDHRTFWFFTLWLFLRFYLIERVSPATERYWKKVVAEHKRLEPKYNRLRRWDDWLLRRIPWLGRYCWNLVVCATK